MALISKLKSLLKADDIGNDPKKLSKRRFIYGLILDFSFLPSVIIATMVYWSLKGRSIMLYDGLLSMLYLVMFIEYIAAAVISVIKRFYFTKFLLIGISFQMVVTAVAFEYSYSYFMVFSVAGLGILTALINILALYGYRNIKIKERENRDDSDNYGR